MGGAPAGLAGPSVDAIGYVAAGCWRCASCRRCARLRAGLRLPLLLPLTAAAKSRAAQPRAACAHPRHALAAAAACCCCTPPAPQVAKIVLTRSARDISIAWSLLYTAGLSLTMVRPRAGRVAQRSASTHARQAAAGRRAASPVRLQSRRRLGHAHACTLLLASHTHEQACYCCAQVYLIMMHAIAAWIPLVLEVAGCLAILSLKLFYERTEVGRAYSARARPGAGSMSMPCCSPSLGDSSAHGSLGVAGVAGRCGSLDASWKAGASGGGGGMALPHHSHHALDSSIRSLGGISHCASLDISWRRGSSSGFGGAPSGGFGAVQQAPQGGHVVVARGGEGCGPA